MENELTTVANLPDSPEKLKEMLASRPVSGTMRKFEGQVAALVEHPAMKFDGTFELTRQLDDEEVQEITESTEGIAIQADAIRGWGNWILGNVMWELSKHNYTPENFLKYISLNRRIEAQNTWAVFREKRYAIPYTHHRDIAKAKLGMKVSHTIATIAERRNLNQLDLRLIVSYAKKAAKKEIEPNLTEENVTAILTIQPHNQKQRLYYLVYEGGIVREFKGNLDGDFPEEAIAVFEGSIENLIKGTLEADIGATG